jgi:peptidoglycan/xylan/chitin deacetylase (PgdA/CDA1 family)/GT2 family glycosyltransferase
LISSSVIIPTYRRAALLSETLDSLASQSEGNFEVIVVCDGEDPQTRVLSEAYSARYPLRWIFTPENQGLPSARNTGVCAAEGELILFLDDDISTCGKWLAHHRECHLAAGSHEWVVVLGRLQNVYSQPTLSRTERLLRKVSEDAFIDFHERCMRLGRDFSWFPHCGVNSSMKRHTFMLVGGYDGAPPLRFLEEDLELGTRLLNRGARMVYEPAAVVFHRNPKNSAGDHLRLAALQSRTDLYRVSVKGQRTAQSQRLASYHHARLVRRWKEHLAWDHPREVLRAAELCRKVADVTGSRFFWRCWSALATSAEYWNGIRSEGITPDSLSDLVGSPVPVLMFHSVSAPLNNLEKEWHISPVRFLRFAEWLRKKGYRCLTPAAWLEGERRSGHVVLTFDDGYSDFYSEAFPILQRFSLGAIVFVVVEQIGKSNDWDRKLKVRPRRLLTAVEIRELHRHGVAFASHSLTHPSLTLLSDKDLRREVFDSKSRLEDLLGAEVTCFSYPFGQVDHRVRAAAAEAGYKIAMSDRGGLNFWEDPLLMKRINVSEKDSLPGFALKVASGRSVPQHISEWLVRVVRRSVDALPDSLSRTLKDELRDAHKTVLTRWWRWKESKSMRPGRMPEDIDQRSGERPDGRA